MTLMKKGTTHLLWPLIALAGLTAGSIFADDSTGQLTGSLTGQPAAALQALREGNTSRLQTLLKSVDPNFKDEEGTPFIMNTVLYGDVETLRLVLNSGADPNATNPAGATALLWSAGDPPRASLLLARGADANVRSALGRTPLLAAASRDGAGEIVEKLLLRHADLEAKDVLKGQPGIWSGNGQSTPLIDAARARDGEALDLLLAMGADIHAVDANGGNALSEAVACSNIENVALLLEHGADFNIRITSQQYTPLMIAAMRNDVEIAEMLIDAGADINAKDAQGSSVLMWAAYGTELNEPRLVQRLLDAGAVLSVRNRRNETAETWAGWHGNSETNALLKQTQRAEVGGR